MKKIDAFINVIIVLLIVGGILNCLTTYAVVPNKYLQANYSGERVMHIAHQERSAGIRIAYYTNEFMLLYILLPLLGLIVLKLFIFIRLNQKQNLDGSRNND